ncbi:MAG TPA: carbohydrate-binding family 9-like protein [Segetibacter sp.]|jgi:hypothetical protein
MKVFSLTSIFIFVILFSSFSQGKNAANGSGSSKTLDNLSNTPLIVPKCEDFELSGKGNNTEWNKAGWSELTKLDTGGRNYAGRFKMMYSSTGIYVLFSGDDDKITTKDYNDNDAIFNGDVFEVFFHPDPSVPVYFEYEINPLSKQLILTLSRLNNQQFSWYPRYRATDNQKPVRRMVDVAGDSVKVGATIESWTAEVFFPFALLGLLPGVPPKSGTTWNANFCRLDYDSGKMIKYSYSPAIEKSFHELNKFLSIKFE